MTIASRTSCALVRAAAPLSIGVFLGIGFEAADLLPRETKTVRAERIEIVDGDGHLRAFLGVDQELTGGHMELVLFRHDRTPTLRLTSFREGSDALASLTIGGDSSEQGNVCAYVGANDAGIQVVRTSPRLSRIDLGVSKTDDSTMSALGIVAGKAEARIVTDATGSVLRMRDAEGGTVVRQPEK